MDILWGGFAVSAVVFMIALCTESYFSWRFLRGLKNKYPEMWELSGRRTIWTDMDLISAWPTVVFLRDRHYLKSKDQQAIMFCEQYRKPLVYSTYAAAVTAGLLFVTSLFLVWFHDWMGSNNDFSLRLN